MNSIEIPGDTCLIILERGRYMKMNEGLASLFLNHTVLRKFYDSYRVALWHMYCFSYI